MADESLTLNRAEVAHYIGVSHTAVQWRIDAGRLQTVTIAGKVRVLRSSMMRWVDERERSQEARTARRLAKIAAARKLLSEVDP